MSMIHDFLGYESPINDKYKELAHKVIQYRKDKGLSRVALARLIGVDVKTLARIEKGKAIFKDTEAKIRGYVSTDT